MSASSTVVTGGAGFIGSHLVDDLIESGDSVMVVDDLSPGDRGRVNPRATLEVVDITDRRRLDGAIDAAQPSVIFHLAAQSSVTRSVADPQRDCEVNVQGTLNLLEAATRHRAAVVFTSTGGALYGSRATLPTPEHAIPAPISPYGASKWAGEAYVATWREATDLPHAICRLGNVYGPRQSPHGEAGVVAILSNHLWQGEAPTLYGFGRATRDYIHVRDVSEALRAAAGTATTVNVATGVATDVRSIFDALQDAAGTALTPVLEPLRAGELEHSCMDPARALKELGWRAAVDLDEGLRTTFRALTAEFTSEDPVTHARPVG